MRNELGDDVHRFLEVLVIPERHADAEEHVEDTENDGNLHLESIKKNDFVLCNLPDRIDAKRVGSSIPALLRGGIDHVVFPIHNVLVRLVSVP